MKRVCVDGPVFDAYTVFGGLATAERVSRQPKLIFASRLAREISAGQCVFQADAAGLEQVAQRHVETLNAALTAGGDRLLDPHDIAFLDQLGDVRRVDHHLDGPPRACRRGP